MAIFSPEFMNKINKKVEVAVVGLGNDVVKIEKEAVQTFVYDYYDEIRAGLVTNPYDRTYDLLNEISAKKSGKGKVRIENTAHTQEIRDKIRSGEVDWKGSILYSLSPSQRARDYVERTWEFMDTNHFRDIIIENLEQSGLNVER